MLPGLEVFADLVAKVCQARSGGFAESRLKLTILLG